MRAAQTSSMSLLSRLRRSASVAAVVLLPAAIFAATPPVVLDFGDFYRRPVGPRGLEPTPKLMALSGSAVEIAGFVVRPADSAEPGATPILAPLPVTLGDEDEALADDLPAAVVYLHGADAGTRAALRECRGRVSVAGELQTGARREDDGRHSFVRLRVLAARCLAASLPR
jgi:hypothetical protein